MRMQLALLCAAVLAAPLARAAAPIPLAAFVHEDQFSNPRLSPDGKHIALTHWSVGDGEEQVGVWQYCDAPSGEAVAQFAEDYPYSDSPEPAAM